MFFYFTRDARILKKNGIQTVAVANNTYTTKGAKGSTYTHQYYFYNDTEKTFSVDRLLSYDSYPKGTTVPLIYLPDRQQTALLGFKTDSVLRLSCMDRIMDWFFVSLFGLPLIIVINLIFKILMYFPQLAIVKHFLKGGNSVKISATRLSMMTFCLLILAIGIFIYTIITESYNPNIRPAILKPDYIVEDSKLFRTEEDSLVLIESDRIIRKLHPDSLSIFLRKNTLSEIEGKN